MSKINNGRPYSLRPTVPNACVFGRQSVRSQRERVPTWTSRNPDGDCSFVISTPRRLDRNLAVALAGSHSSKSEVRANVTNQVSQITASAPTLHMSGTTGSASAPDSFKLPKQFTVKDLIKNQKAIMTVGKKVPRSTDLNALHRGHIYFGIAVIPGQYEYFALPRTVFAEGTLSPTELMTLILTVNFMFLTTPDLSSDEIQGLVGDYKKEAPTIFSLNLPNNFNMLPVSHEAYAEAHKLLLAAVLQIYRDVLASFELSQQMRTPILVAITPYRIGGSLHSQEFNVQVNISKPVAVEPKLSESTKGTEVKQAPTKQEKASYSKLRAEVADLAERTGNTVAIMSEFPIRIEDARQLKTCTRRLVAVGAKLQEQLDKQDKLKSLSELRREHSAIVSDKLVNEAARLSNAELDVLLKKVQEDIDHQTPLFEMIHEFEDAIRTFQEIMPPEFQALAVVVLASDDLPSDRVDKLRSLYQQIQELCNSPSKSYSQPAQVEKSTPSQRAYSPKSELAKKNDPPLAEVLNSLSMSPPKSLDDLERLTHGRLKLSGSFDGNIKNAYLNAPEAKRTIFWRVLQALPEPHLDQAPLEGLGKWHMALRNHYTNLIQEGERLYMARIGGGSRAYRLYVVKRDGYWAIVYFDTRTQATNDFEYNRR